MSPSFCKGNQIDGIIGTLRLSNVQLRPLNKSPKSGSKRILTQHRSPTTPQSNTEIAKEESSVPDLCECDRRPKRHSTTQASDERLYSIALFPDSDVRSQLGKSEYSDSGRLALQQIRPEERDRNPIFVQVSKKLDIANRVELRLQ